MCQLFPSAILSTLDAHCYHLGAFKMTKGPVASIRDYDFIGSGQEHRISSLNSFPSDAKVLVKIESGSLSQWFPDFAAHRNAWGSLKLLLSASHPIYSDFVGHQEFQKLLGNSTAQQN